MKALILAGGRGTRLRPITHTSNKHVIPIGNRPMIFRVIEDAVEIGIKDIIININKGDKELPVIIDAANDLWKVKIRYIEQPEPNGMMYPIKLAEKLIGDDEFFFSAGDNILSGGLKSHLADFKSKKSDAHVLVVRRPDYKSFGVGVINGGLLVKTVEKPQKFISDLVLTAIYFFTPAVFKSFSHIKPIDPNNSGKPEYYPPVVNNWLIDNGYKFTASEITGYWKDTGTFDSLLDANRMVLDNDLPANIDGGVDSKSVVQGRVELKRGAKIINSTLRGPLSIEAGTVIKDSYIGPYTSVGKNCEVLSSEIENSMLLGNVKICNHKVRIDSSVFGWNSQLDGGNPRNVSIYRVGNDSLINSI